MNAAFFLQQTVGWRDLRRPLLRLLFMTGLCATLFLLAYRQQLDGEAAHQKRAMALQALMLKIETLAAQQETLRTRTALALRLQPSTPPSKATLLPHLFTCWPGQQPATPLSLIKLGQQASTTKLPPGWHEERLEVTLPARHAEQIFDFAERLTNHNGGVGLLRACTLRRQLADDDAAPDKVHTQCQIAWLSFHGLAKP